jgi:hypothetical protein
MIKTFSACAALAALLTLSACMTLGTTSGTPTDVPASRIHIKELVEPSAGENEVRIIRDGRLAWGANALEFSVNYVALADLKPGETVSAWLPDGEYTFSVKPINNPQNLAPEIITLKLQKGQKHTVRIDGGEFKVTIEEVGVQ